MKKKTLSYLLISTLGLTTLAVANTPVVLQPKFYNQTMTMTFVNKTTCSYTLRNSGAQQLCSGPSVVLPYQSQPSVFICKQGAGLFLSVEGAEKDKYMTTLQLEHSNPQGYYYLGDLFDQGLVGYYVNDDAALTVGHGFGDLPNSGLQDALPNASFTVVAKGDFGGNCSN